MVFGRSEGIFIFQSCTRLCKKKGHGIFDSRLNFQFVQFHKTQSSGLKERQVAFLHGKLARTGKMFKLRYKLPTHARARQVRKGCVG